MTRYWLYKNNAADGGPAGYCGDWLASVFKRDRVIEWGGHYSTRSGEVAKRLNDGEVAAGDVVVAYQTDDKAIVGFCRVERVTGTFDHMRIYVRPVEVLDPAFHIHDHKAGTPLASSNAVNGMVMLRELSKAEMTTLRQLCGAPMRVMKGQQSSGGYRPPKIR